MKPMTPNGIRTRPTCKPFGRRHIFTTSPTGSGRAATSSRACTMEFMTLSDRVSRSINAAGCPSALAWSTSLAFSAWMSACRSLSNAAMRSSTWSLTPRDRLPNGRAACLASRAISLITLGMSISSSLLHLFSMTNINPYYFVYKTWNWDFRLIQIKPFFLCINQSVGGHRYFCSIPFNGSNFKGLI